MDLSPDDRIEVRDQVRAVLASIDDGRLEATPAERAYLAGALDAATRLTENDRFM